MRGLTCFQYSTSCLLDACAYIDLLTCCFVACCVLFVCVVVYRFVRFSLTHLLFFLCIYVVFFVNFWCLFDVLDAGSRGISGSLRGTPKTPRGNPSQRRLQY